MVLSVAKPDTEADLDRTSRLLDYLPAVFREDKMMNRFLLIFESILNPIENTVDNIPLYFDPGLTPECILPWLASWLDIALDPNWPVERRRELLKNAAELYRWRGTRRGLSEYLRIYTGVVPEILEYIPGMILDEKTELGVNTVLGSSGTGHHFTVILQLNEDEKIEPRVVKNIIESQKPAHTAYTLQILTSPSK
jgi:phage tail-like protein